MPASPADPPPPGAKPPRSARFLRNRRPTPRTPQRSSAIYIQELRRSQALATVAQAVAWIGTPAEWGARAVQAVSRATGWKMVALFRVSDTALQLVAARGFDADALTRLETVPRTQPALSGLAAQRREPQVLRELDLPANELDDCLGHPEATALPLLVRGRSYGALLLLDTHHHRTDPEELAFLQSLASTLAIGLASEDIYASAEESRQRMQALEKAKDDFLSVASHELRTPLTPLKGLTQSLLRQLRRARHEDVPLDLERLERYLHTMDRQVDRLTGLVNDLLDISRSRSGRFTLHLAEADLVVVVRSVMERFDAVAELTFGPDNPLASSASSELARQAHAAATANTADSAATAEKADTARAGGAGGAGRPSSDEGTGEGRHVIHFDPAVPALVGHWDAARLEQVLTNLLSNSLKYTPAGGVIEVSLRREDSSDGPVAHVWVQDQGIGIPPEQMKDLFQPFQRLVNAPPEQYGGLGLGLSISREIVQRHGGRIWAESPGVDQGASFHLTLPLTGPTETVD